MQAGSRILHTYLRIYRSISEEFRGRFGSVTLTFPQTLVLCLLTEQGPMPISELAKSIGSANSTISGVLDRLESMKLIQRIRSDQDRRVVYVALTPQFETIQQELEASVAESVPSKLLHLTAQELEQVETGLNVLEQALKRR